jgi:hypothetical protein
VSRVPSELLDALRKEGIDTPFGEGGEISYVKYLVWHATATSAGVSDLALRNLLEDGRADLNGPLSQWGLERDGQLPFIADGKCNHNGYGDGANNTWAIEAANDNRGEPFPNVQVDVWCRASAVMCLYMKTTPEAWIRAHKETDPRRKSDPVGLNMDTMRANIALHMLRISGFNPAPSPPPPPPYVVTKRNLRLKNMRDTMSRLQVTVNTDDNGRAWVPLDGAVAARPRVPWGSLISVRPLGPNPSRDGYWPIPETAEQQKGEITLLTVEGGPPQSPVVLYLIVADA